MAEDDTLNAPEEGHVSEPDEQAAEPQEQETEGQQEQQEQAPPQPPPKQPTPEEIEERAFQRAASWLGRREAENTEKILRRVAEIVEPIKRTNQPAQPQTPTIDTAQFLENPEAALEHLVPKLLDREVSRRTQAENAFSQDVIRHAANLMGNDPLFSDQALGNEVVQEITKNFAGVDRSLRPETAARLLVADSYRSVASRRAATKTNPLAGNKPQKGIGTITSPAPTKETPKPVKMDAETKRIAEMFGNTDEEIRKYLG